MNVRQPISHLAVDGVSLLYPDVRVLTDFSLTVDAGQVVALIGQNGSGKSTAIGVAAGELLPDRGRVVRPERVGVLHQELAPAGDGTVGALVENAVAPVRALAERVEALSQAVARAPNDESLENELALAIAEAELADAWTIEVGVAEVMAGVGLADLPRERELTALSGGQRQRLALAAVLVARPTLLLLDEPTNHLDEAGQEFLTDRLRRWRGPVLLASHDRAFLDEVADQVVDLDPAPSPAQRRRHGTVYTGAYSDYRRERAAELRRWAEQYATEQAELERLRGVAATSHSEVFHKDTVATEMRKAAKFYSDRSAKTIGRRVRNARKRLERLEVEQIGPPPAPLRFTGFEEVLGERAGALGQSESAAEPVLALSEAGLSGRVTPTSLALGPQDRLLVTGANGTGKTTLIELLAGHLVPDHGHREVVRGLRIGVLAQDVRWDATDLAGSPADAFDRRQVWPPDGVISPRDLLRPLHELSLGTQRRVALALLAADPPDVLCLDEPTNHLALGLVEELEAAIDSHPGAVVVASHDRWLRRRWTGRRLDLGQRTDVRAGA